MIRCPYCGEPENRVVDARTFEEGESIRRRRECLQCSKHFTTFEKVEEIPIFILKKDGSKQLFDKNKILEGLLRAGEKSRISIHTFQNIADEVEREIRSEDMREISSDSIGTRVLEKLLPLDEVTYVRYASVFYRYEDIETFKEELERVLSLRRGEERQ